MKRLFAMIFALSLCLCATAGADAGWKDIYADLLSDQGTGIEYYMIADIDGNGVPELLIMTGECEADMILTVYTEEDGVGYCIGELSGGHSVFGSLPNGGLLRDFGQMGDEMLFVINLDNSFLTEECVFEQEQVEDYLGIDTLEEYAPTDLSGLNWTGNAQNWNQELLDAVR